MSFDTNTPERQAKIAQYLRMIQRKAPVWDREKFEKSNPDKDKNKKSDTSSQKSD